MEATMADIHTATLAYERWFASHTNIVQADLDQKHKLMHTSPFILLRGTFYRWAELFPAALPQLMKAPAVLAAGDLHIENFGTWRDAEGRLNWGINDFDEAHPMPFTNDLIRLTTSAAFAIEEGKLSLTLKAVCEIILGAYKATLVGNGRPFVLAEKNRDLSRMAHSRLKDPLAFFKKLDNQAKISGAVPDAVITAINQALPRNASKPAYFQRQTGVGSLGRQRYLALCELGGSRIAREAKVTLPSAWSLLHPEQGKEPTVYLNQLSENCLRSHDPFLRVDNGWVIRRLAPDCTRVELSELPRERDERALLEAMGAEAANLHLGTPTERTAVLRFLEKNSNWLLPATKKMVGLTKQDFVDWKAGPKN
jgi:hypothetical protein